MRDEKYTPFVGKRSNAPLSTQVIRRFRKPGHVAELRERKVTQFHAIEWLLFVDGSMIESRMYHGSRLGAHASELSECCESMLQSGWQEDQAARVAAH